MSDSISPSAAAPLQPLTGAAKWQADLTAGFLVFLIALPLCLAISLASGFPATAGVFTAIIGGLLAPWISNSELTIKGPAAGLIVIVLGCVMEFGGGRDASPDAQRHAVQLALGVSVVAGLLQVAFALVRSGILAEIFPSAAVHGMLAAIGVIIMAKQTHIMLGVTPEGKEPLHQIAEIPHSIMHANPEIAVIGVLGLILLFAWPVIARGFLRKIPAQLLVAVMGIALGAWFDLEHAHTYSFASQSYEVSNKMLVAVPSNILSAIMLPDFSGVLTPVGLKWIAMFALIGTLESLLSAKAVDLIDPLKRQHDPNRDLLAIGIGNTLAACIGGLPMISEIVRSRANIDNGAQSRYANMVHGLCLLLFVALLPGLIHLIPLSALAAMLVYTGSRLAHPKEFAHMYQVGPGQLAIFVATLIGVLATDLLVGVAIGVALKCVLHVCHGVMPWSLIKADVEVDETAPDTTTIRVKSPAVFSTWLSLRRRLVNVNADRKIIVDLSQAQLVDHTTMEKLTQLQDDLSQSGRTIIIRGLDNHRPLSSHPLAARKRGSQMMA
ncbi:MAG TPA: SulP family inorganic anion transporter [Planctomycetaceae bacterium]|nr:SulP family inorganic anion transporter [Planctomycetaceae bacterium]